MQAKNTFKAKVIKKAVELEIATHPQAMQQVEETFEIHPALKDTEESYSATVGEYRFYSGTFYYRRVK